ncbi:unnamed protein product [Dracunculus medinensis]|uniref:CULT domain-containing protein n=1 Tax=Dracunculus medinensis TaxID=318479 RepID=A0A3P7PD04_DRAME|nr:unnamed protein product [Dracunculus medinensis]
MICRSCGHTVVDKVLLANVRSKLALRSYNMTILGRNQLVQVFENPVPESFDVITASSADLKLQGKAYMHATWFPGFEWTVGMCPHCSAHLGWLVSAF